MSSRSWFAPALAAAALAMPACGGDDDPSRGGSSESAGPGAQSGTGAVGGESSAGGSGGAGGAGTGGEPSGGAGGAPDPASPWLAVMGQDAALDGSHLWITDTNVSPPSLLSVSPPAHQVIYSEDAWWAPDASRIAYLALPAPSTQPELFAADVTSMGPGAPAKVNGALPNFGSVTAFEWAPDGDRIAYLADATVQDDYEATFVDLSAGPNASPIFVHAPADAMKWSPAGDKLAVYGPNGSSSPMQLFVFDMTGAQPGPAQPLATLASLASVRDDWSWSSDSAWLIYRANSDAFASDELFLVDVAGPAAGAPVKLNGPLPAMNGNVLDAHFTPDGLGVVFRATVTPAGPSLFWVDLSGGAPAMPVLVSAADHYVWSFRLAPDSKRVAYQTLGGPSEDLFVADLSAAAAPPQQVDATLPPEVDVTAEYAWSSNAAWLAYKVVHKVGLPPMGNDELYVSATSGAVPGPPIRVDMSPSTGPVLSFVVAPDASGLVYRAIGPDPTIAELWWVALGASPGAPVRMNQAITTETGVLLDDDPFRPDGARFHYRAWGCCDSEVLHLVTTAAPGVSEVVLSASAPQVLPAYAAWAP